MSGTKKSFIDKLFSFNVPHVLVLIIGIILICCGLTYILPAGLYDIDPRRRVPEPFYV